MSDFLPKQILNNGKNTKMSLGKGKLKKIFLGQFLLGSGTAAKWHLM